MGQRSGSPWMVWAEMMDRWWRLPYEMASPSRDSGSDVDQTNSYESGSIETDALSLLLREVKKRTRRANLKEGVAATKAAERDREQR